MIAHLKGTVVDVADKALTLSVNGIGLAIATPDTSSFIADKQATLFTYMHWNQDKGPSLYGFASELDRTVFCLIIQTPKVGPNMALSILSQLSASTFLDAVTTQNDAALSSISGIGEKTAEQLITSLRHKVSKMISKGKLKADDEHGFTQWQSVTDVFATLNYSRTEINGAIQYLSDKYAGQDVGLDQLIRAGLSYLSKGA